MTDPPAEIPEMPADRWIDRFVSLLEPVSRVTRPRLDGVEHLPADGSLLVGNQTTYGFLDLPFTAADGTHVAGIIAGDGNQHISDSGDKCIGIAPGAHLIAIKASDDAGNATILDAIYGLQFAVDHKDTTTTSASSTSR